MIGRRRKNLPKWRYDFNCRKCDNIQFIDDPARGRLGDYCVACVEAFDHGRPNPIHADDDRVVHENSKRDDERAERRALKVDSKRAKNAKRSQYHD